METLSTFLQQSLTVSGPRAVSACHSTRYGNNDVLEGRKQKTVRGSSLKRAAHIETLNASMELENARGCPPPLAADLRSVVSSLSLSLSTGFRAEPRPQTPFWHLWVPENASGE